MQFVRKKTFIISILICSLISLTGCTNNKPARMKLVKSINSDGADRAAIGWARGVEETESKILGAASHRQSFKSSFGRIYPQDSSERLRGCKLLVRQRGEGTSKLVDAEIYGDSMLRLREQGGNWTEFRSSSIDGKGFGSGTDQIWRRWDFLGFRNTPNSLDKVTRSMKDAN